MLYLWQDHFFARIEVVQTPRGGLGLFFQENGVHDHEQASIPLELADATRVPSIRTKRRVCVLLCGNLS